MEETNKIHEGLVEARVLATNIFASLPKTVEARGLTSESKLPFKTLCLREVLIHRVAELALVAVDLFECKKFVPAFIITRSIVETVAMTYWLSQKVGEHLENREDSKLDEFLMKAMMGSREQNWHHEAHNVLTAVNKLDKNYSGFRKMYDKLCEFLHPNWAGALGAYGEINTEQLSLSLGSKNNPTQIIHGLAPFILSLTVFEAYYNLLSKQLTALNNLYENQDESEV
jgi:hypothetical protein